MNKEIVGKIKEVKTAHELKELAAKNGYNLTDGEAKGYFDLYHNSGVMNDNELDNVVGGSQCRNGKNYSSDPPYDLIVFPLNYCSMYKREEGTSDVFADLCANCTHMYKPRGLTLYCDARTYDNDPLNPKK